MLGDALYGAVGGIRGRGEDEEDFVIVVLKFGQSRQVALEPWFHALARTQHRRARRVESGVAAESASRVRQPLQALPHQVHAYANLHDGQAIKESLHVARI